MGQFLVAVAFSMLHLYAFAEAKTITEKSEIEKIIAPIPIAYKDFNYKNIGERIQNIGMKIDSVRLDRVGERDAEPPYYKAGDLVIQIRTSTPNSIVKALCPITGNPEYIKRGEKYIPNNLTAYWLMNNRCDFK